jgi:glucose-6-phosphate isomerase
MTSQNTRSSGIQYDEPRGVRVSTSGRIRGRSGLYDKHLSHMSGVYRDADAYRDAVSAQGGDTLVYRVEENRVGDGDGALILGTSTMQPGRISAEFAVTRGHLHRRADRAEVYHCLAGHGVMLLDTVTGQSRALEMTPGIAVHVPGGWVHRSVNVGDEPLVTTFVYNADAGQNYDIIARAGGMSQLIVADDDGGWASIPNPDHIGYVGTAR